MQSIDCMSHVDVNVADNFLLISVITCGEPVGSF